ncbi:hypothetical protein ABNC94_17945 [Paenibacillus larvae]
MDYYSYQQLIFQIQWLLEKTQLLDDRLSQLQSDIDKIKSKFVCKFPQLDCAT